MVVIGDDVPTEINTRVFQKEWEEGVVCDTDPEGCCRILIDGAILFDPPCDPRIPYQIDPQSGEEILHPQSGLPGCDGNPAYSCDFQRTDYTTEGVTASECNDRLQAVKDNPPDLGDKFTIDDITAEWTEGDCDPADECGECMKDDIGIPYSLADVFDVDGNPITISGTCPEDGTAEDCPPCSEFRDCIDNAANACLNQCLNCTAETVEAFKDANENESLGLL